MEFEQTEDEEDDQMIPASCKDDNDNISTSAFED